jgi:hypothetical protein
LFHVRADIAPNDNRAPGVQKSMTSSTRLFESLTGLVERVDHCSRSRRLGAERFSRQFRSLSCVRGVSVWQVGGAVIMSDPDLDVRFTHRVQLPDVAAAAHATVR